MDADTKLAENGAIERREVRRVTVAGMILNLGLSGVKFAVGILASSQALVADAVHSLSDWATDIVVLVGVRYWSAPPDEKHPYGHGRIETIISIIIGIALAAVGVGLAVRAVSTMGSPSHRPPGWMAFWVAIASLVCKEILYQWSIRIGKRVRSSALIANAWHHRSDALSSLPVALAVVGTTIWPDLHFLDHVATVIVAVLILQAARQIVLPGLRELIDVSVDEEQRAMITQLVQETAGVRSLHKLRTRKIGSGVQVDLHVQVAPALTVVEGHDIATDVKIRLLAETQDVIDVLVHIEPDESNDV